MSTVSSKLFSVTFLVQAAIYIYKDVPMAIFHDNGTTEEEEVEALLSLLDEDSDNPGEADTVDEDDIEPSNN